jgi:16S rRNA processing protein RimM
VLRPHGLRGELRVSAFSPTARNLQRGRPVYLGAVRHIVKRARQDREAWIIELDGLNGRDAAEPYRGELLETPDAEVLRDDADSYFVHELIGLRVVLREGGRELGSITEVLQTGANDVYVVHGETGEVLVPAIDGVIDEIDLHAGMVSITPLAGLLDESK